MSVGAGSIKRAAKAAEESMETKTAGVKETKAVDDSAEVKESGTAKGSTEAKRAKSAEGSTESKEEKAAKKKVSQKSFAGKADEKGSVGGKTSVAAEAMSSYVAYGVGQELPIYLM